LVLRDVDLTIPVGTSLGVCGRTGSGKSTMLMTLLRLVDPVRGQQLADGVDLHTLGLHDLRGKMLVIPQDPPVFSGTVRFNLDPFSEKTDAEVMEVVKQIRLAEKVESMGGLNGEVSENGGNFSHGERQLLALGRTLVRKTPGCVLLLDEATSSLDANLDAVLQDVIRADFYNQGATVIAIAHRLQTIINYDNIALFDNGELKEFGSPARLRQRPDGLFNALAREAGL